MTEPSRSSIRSTLVTVAALAASLLFSAPPFIAEVFSWVPESILHRAPSSVWNFWGLSEIGAAIGDSFTFLWLSC